MKKLIISAMLLTATTLFAGEGWLTDFKEAQEQAKQGNKPILLDFTGSDWCGWCVKLDKDTFSQPAFQEFAKEHLVLMEVDFPKSKSQSPETAAQNNDLKDKFGVRGFPTLVLLGSDGKELAKRSGYLPGGPDAMIQWIKEAKK